MATSALSKLHESLVEIETLRAIPKESSLKETKHAKAEDRQLATLRRNLREGIRTFWISLEKRLEWSPLSSFFFLFKNTHGWWWGSV